MLVGIKTIRYIHLFFAKAMAGAGYYIYGHLGYYIYGHLCLHNLGLSII
jgi:hypothetical protein